MEGKSYDSLNTEHSCIETEKNIGQPGNGPLTCPFCSYLASVLFDRVMFHNLLSSLV